MSALDKLVDLGEWEFMDGQGLFNGDVNILDASDELAVLRARVILLQQLLFQINDMNNMANLNDAELWNVNGEFQKIIDVTLNT